jgi:hypothetical protein
MILLYDTFFDIMVMYYYNEAGIFSVVTSSGDKDWSIEHTSPIHPARVRHYFKSQIIHDDLGEY